MKSSDLATLSNPSFVISTPVLNRDAKHAVAGLSNDINSLISAIHLTSCLVIFAITMGFTTPFSSVATCPGLCPLRSL